MTPFSTIPRKSAFVWLVALTIANLGQLQGQTPPGPGFPNVPQTPGEMLAEFNAGGEQDDVVRTVVLDYIDGYLYMDTRALTTGNSSHTIHTWDVSDPRNPFEAHRVGGERGQHTSSRFLPDYRVNNRGNEFVNVSDPLNMFSESPPGYILKFQGSRGSYPLPYEYFGGNPVEIYDARTGTTLARMSEHGFEGLTIPIGNLMIVVGIRGQESRGVATYDISDPSNPVLLDVIGPTDPVWKDDNPAYEAFVWKHFIVIPNVLGGRRGDDCAFVDFSDPTNLRHVLYMNGNGDYGTGLPGRTRYAQFQDNKMFLGCGIYDMSPLENDEEPILLAVDEHDSEYMLPLGNLYVIAENSEQGDIADFGGPFPTRIYAHQAEPDLAKPTVAYTDPADGATQQHVKSRVGVIIHETLIYDSINSTTFRVFPTSGGPDLTGTYNATDKDILIFTPDSDLEEGTTYRVLLEGIQDAVGNKLDAFSFEFTTAGENTNAPIIVTDIESSVYPVSLDGSIDLSVVANGGTGPLSYSWDFGDGSPVTNFDALATTVSHSYAAEGHYTARVQVHDSSVPPRTLSKGIVVTVSDIPAGPPPGKATQILVDESKRLVWTVNPDNNTVSAIDADTLSKVREFPVGKDPRSIAQDANGNLWVTCLDADRLEVLDENTGIVIKSMDFRHGSRPHDVLFNQEKNYAYVTLKGSGKVIRIDPATTPLAIDAELNAGPTATAIALGAAGERIWVNRFISQDSNGEVYSFDAANAAAFGFESTIVLGIDATTIDDGQQGRGLLNYLADIAIDPKSEYAYVTAKKDNILRGGFRDGQALTHDSSVRTAIAKIDLASNEEMVEQRVDIDDSSQPTALAFSPLGDYLFIALQGNNEVKVLDVFTGNVVATLSTGLAPQGLAFDKATQQLFVKNLTDRSVTVFDLGDGLREGDFSQPAIATVDTVESELFTAEILRGKQIFYNASDERMSFEGYLSCATCHQDGDHDGRTWDFTARGEGLRNTTNLRGRSGTGHGNVHWSGNFDEIQDFELDMVNAFGGRGFLAEVGGPNASMGEPNGGRSEDLDALAAYVASLTVESVERSPHRAVDGSLTAEAEVGKKLFEGYEKPENAREPMACVLCHRPSTGFTDSTIGNHAGGSLTFHNVGTIKPSSGMRLGGGDGSLAGIDTPTLWGLHASSPYLHDGSAATLTDVFDQFMEGVELGSEGAVHNLTETGYNLTEAEKNSLLAYLLQVEGNDGPFPSYSVWAEGYLPVVIGLEEEDFDSDGLSNLVEYALGGDPRNPLDGGAQIGFSVAGGSLVIEFDRRNNDPALRYSVETSESLLDGSWVEDPSIDIEGGSNSSILESIRSSLSIEAVQKFLRLRVEQE